MNDAPGLPAPLTTLIEAFRKHQKDSEFLERHEDERAVIEAVEAGLEQRGELQAIQAYVEANLHDREITMAVAVMLQFCLDSDDEVDAAITITKLLRSPFSRTRYRAAHTAARRTRHGATRTVTDVLKAGVKAALRTEECENVLFALAEAVAALYREKKRELSELEQQIWNLLHKRILSTQDLCGQLHLADKTAEDLERSQNRIRKAVEKMRACGCDIKWKRSGYWRGDAPPNY